jgi:hypothetical protein
MFAVTWVFILGHSAFGKYSDLPFFHILLRYSLILKWINLCFSIYTQYPIMTKQKKKLRNFCKFIKMKYHFHISIQILYSVLC